MRGGRSTYLGGMAVWIGVLFTVLGSTVANPWIVAGYMRY